MTTIAEVSDRIGITICKQAGLEDEVKKICYGIEYILVWLISQIIILSIGFLVGAFKETLAVIIGLLMVRYIIGGSHLSGFVRCLVYSVVMVVGLAVLFTNGLIYFPSWLLVICFALGVVIIFRNAPLVTSDKKFSHVQIIRRRLLGSAILATLTVINALAPGFWSTGLLIGILLSVFNISLLGVNLTKGVEILTKRKEGLR